MELVNINCKYIQANIMETLSPAKLNFKSAMHLYMLIENVCIMYTSVNVTEIKVIQA